MSGTIAAIATGIYAYSAYKGIEAQREASHQRNLAAAEEQKRYVAEQKKADIQTVRSAREQIRASYIAQASMVNRAALSGGTGGSAVAGGTASVGSQTAGNLNYMAQIAEQNTAIGNAAAASANYQAAASSAQSDAAIWGAIGQTAMGVSSGYSKYVGR